jgi:hypothetical protein
MVLELHAVIFEVYSLSAHLPALGLQLVELSGLHPSTAKFGMWLRAAEETLRWSKSSLASRERALSRMEDGWKENVKVV